jgi:hypothetical protein
MRRISAYSISLLIILISNFSKVFGQDTLFIPLKVRVGIEAGGPVMYFSDKDILKTEGYISIDLNEKMSAAFSAGYLNYKHAQSKSNYEYDYLSNGCFFRTGVDFNLLKPKKSQGNYWAGVGLRYSFSVFNQEIPSIEKINYWGTGSVSVASQRYWGHFLEVSPGVRGEIFNNISLGWNISLRKLLYTGTGNDLRPLNLPGFGNANKSFAYGISYFITWNISYKKIRVIIKKSETEDTSDSENDSESDYEQPTQDNVQQNTGTRQSRPSIRE